MKLALFSSYKSFLLFSFFLIFIISFRLFFIFNEYKEFIEKPFFYTKVKVIDAYIKRDIKNRPYQVLKVKSKEGLTFYTASSTLQLLKDYSLRLQLFPSNKISFLDYLGLFYIKSKIKSKTKIKSPYPKLEHQNILVNSFYGAIFFATPIDKELRESISKLGVSHLVALSGFHLGILWGVFYAILVFIYQFFQQKYFPYRYSLIDIGSLVLILLAIYLLYVNMPPSLIRAYAMVLFGWFLIVLGVEVKSFSFLFITSLIILTIFPTLINSLGFLFSLTGVFYIFLILKYFENFNKWFITLFFIPVGIYILMLPVVHLIFPITSLAQLLSPILSLLFIPFYPFAIFLHILGLGNLLDNYLLALFEFSLNLPSKEDKLYLEIGITYILFSLLAIKSKKVFIIISLYAFFYAIDIFFIKSIKI